MDAIASVKFIFLLSQIFGIFPYTLTQSKNGYSFVQSKPRLLYTIFVFTFFTILLGTYLSAYVLIRSFAYTPEISSKSVLLLSSLSCYFSLPVTFKTIISNRKTFCFWFNNLNELFFMLPKESTKKVKKLNFLLLGVGGGFVVMVATAQVFISKTFLKSNDFLAKELSHLKAYIGILYLAIWIIKIFTQFFLVFVTMLGEAVKETQKGLQRDWKIKGKKYWLLQLRAMRVRDLLMVDFSEFLHCVFMPVISLQLSWVFGSILFNVTVAARVGVPTFVQFIWASYLIFDAFTYVYVCEVTEKQAEKTAFYLQTCFINCDDVDLKEQIELLSLQLQHTKLQFFCMGFVKLNFSLLYSMIGSLTSYFVILIQFQNQPPVEKEC